MKIIYFFLSINITEINIEDNELYLCIIHKGQRLFRAARTCEKHPKARKCRDTGKVGSYFSLDSPILSELIVDEYNQDMIISEYIVMEDILLLYDKWSYLKLPESANKNISHLTNCTLPPKWQWDIVKNKPNEHIEVFLNAADLHHILYLDKYHYTPEDTRRKYY